mmetsp:Transcript_26219/g.55752  ORF Transcript_26219/g.55752 Transcript_26219/m.55752 type:complete len:243 (+) Transcript_26219:497-1225(+)
MHRTGCVSRIIVATPVPVLAGSLLLIPRHPARLQPRRVVPHAVGMVQLRQAAHLPYHQRERLSVVTHRVERHALHCVGLLFELVYRVVDRAEGSGREEGELVEIALVPGEGEGVVLNGPRGRRRRRHGLRRGSGRCILWHLTLRNGSHIEVMSSKGRVVKRLVRGSEAILGGSGRDGSIPSVIIIQLAGNRCGGRGGGCRYSRRHIAEGAINAAANRRLQRLVPFQVLSYGRGLLLPMRHFL